MLKCYIFYDKIINSRGIKKEIKLLPERKLIFMKCKKIIAALLAASVVFSAAGCSSSEKADENTAENTSSETSSETHSGISETAEAFSENVETENIDWEKEREFLKDNFPTFDGSTSAIPLEAAYRQKIFGISEDEATEQVHHNKTHVAFANFMDGKTDIVLTVPLTDEQQKEADEKGAVMTPVAKEGFVFCVNKNNPVDSLTEQQIKDIYSGKITNWKDVGGEDMEILAYQRNKDSGSQTLMDKFMGDTPLMDAPQELIPGMMGELMDAIAIYDNSAGAIGYSVYSYAAQMYINTTNVKFIKVNGVEPTKETMENGTYPLLSATYALYDGNLPEDSAVKRMVRWMTSPEGQQAAKDAGYIPAVGEITENAAPLYQTLGTGMKRPDNYVMPSSFKALDSLFDSNAVEIILTDELNEKIASGDYESTDIWDDITHYRLDGIFKGVTYNVRIKDEAVRNAVNEWLNTNIAEMEKEFDDSEYGSGYLSYKPNDTEEYDFTTPVSVMGKCVNNILSITLTDYSGDVSKIRTGCFDLKTGKKLEFSDLFFEGTDFMSEINRQAEREYNQNLALYYSDPTNLNEVFSGIRGTDLLFDIETLYLSPEDNPWYSYIEYFYYRNDAGKDMVIYADSDVDGIFEDDVVYSDGFFDEFSSNGKYVNVSDKYTYTQFETSDFADEKTLESINEKIKNAISNEQLCNSYFTSYKVHYAEFTEETSFDEYAKNHQLQADGIIYGDLCYAVMLYEIMTDSETFYYNLDSGELLVPSDFLKDGWESETIWEYSETDSDGEYITVGDCDAPDISNMAISGLSFTYRFDPNDSIDIWFAQLDSKGDRTYTAHVPAEFRSF